LCDLICDNPTINYFKVGLSTGSTKTMQHKRQQ
jgi:hypothetical protein